MSFFTKKEEKKEVPKHADLGRNDPCHCGSGKKYKKCHADKDQAAERKVLDENWSKAETLAKEQAEKNAKESKEAPSAPQKHSGPQKSVKQQHPTFIPGQVSAPRKSGGG